MPIQVMDEISPLKKVLLHRRFTGTECYKGFIDMGSLQNPNTI